MTTTGRFSPTRRHLSRLMKIWRSAGWPLRDAVEIDLLAANWVQISISQSGHESLRVTDAGVKVLADARERGRRELSAHDRLANKVGQHLLDSGRIVWRELSFRAQFNMAQPPAGAQQAPTTTLPLTTAEDEPSTVPGTKPRMSWRIARPDVFSVRSTSVEDYLHPMVHEIKINRADLLSDLRKGAKRESYQWLCCECFYVFPFGTAEPKEIPDGFGVWVLRGAIEDGRLELLRPARHSPCKLPFAVWLALAKAMPMVSAEDPVQDCLANHQPSEQDTNAAAANLDPIA